MKKEALFTGIALAFALEISHCAFSYSTRQEIKKRAKKKLGYYGSELSGATNEPLECAHIDHNRKSPDYNDPDNGRLVTLYEHLYLHETLEGRNGLTPEQNREAIVSIRRRIQIWEETQTLDDYYQACREEEAKARV